MVTLYTTVETSTIPAIAQWVQQKLEPHPQAMARYCILRNYLLGRGSDHARIAHEEMPKVLTEEDAAGLLELARLGVIKLTLNGNSREVRLVP